MKVAWQLSPAYVSNSTTPELYVVVFAQNVLTKEVYQVAIRPVVYKPVNTVGTVAPRASLFSIYPNPNAGVFTLQFPEVLRQPLEVRVVDLFGRELLTQSIPQGTQQYEVRLSTLEAGVYYVLLHDASGVRYAIKRFIVD